MVHNPKIIYSTDEEFQPDPQVKIGINVEKDEDGFNIISLSIGLDSTLHESQPYKLRFEYKIVVLLTLLDDDDSWDNYTKDDENRMLKVHIPNDIYENNLRQEMAQIIVNSHWPITRIPRILFEDYYPGAQN